MKENYIKKLRLVIEYGFYLLVFLLPLQTRWIIKTGELNGGYWEYGAISLYTTDALLILLILLFLIFRFQLLIVNKKINLKFKIKNLKIAKYWYLIAGLELMILISIFFAPDKLVAIYSYIRFLLGIGLFWLVAYAIYNRTKLIISLLAGVALQAGLGVWQFLTQSTFSSKWLGLALHQASDLGTSVIEVISSMDGVEERWLRAYGGLDHPNIFGGVLVICILLIIWRLNLPTIFKLKNLLPFYYLLLFTFVTALFFTFSRGAWVSLIISLAAILIIMVIKKNLKGQKNFLQLILVLGILIFVLLNLYGDLASARLAGNTRLEIKSNTERINSYQESLKLIKNNWLFGSGMGNYTLAISREGTLDKPSWYYQPVHNSFLLIWSEIGILGLLFFISFLIYILYFIFKNFRENANLALYKIPLFIALLFMLMVDHWWWSLHFGVLFFWLIMGLILREFNNKK